MNYGLGARKALRGVRIGTARLGSRVGGLLLSGTSGTPWALDHNAFCRACLAATRHPARERNEARIVRFCEKYAGFSQCDIVCRAQCYVPVLGACSVGCVG